MTKKQAVFKHLLENDYIESTQAFEKYGATRLAAIVFDLKEDGVEISTIRMTGDDRYGNSSWWGRYRLVDKTVAREIYRSHYEKCAS